MRIMKKYLIIAFFCVLPLSLVAQESTSAFQILRLPTSAHVAGLGGENLSTIDDDASAVLHNPALLSSVSSGTLGLSFMTYADGAKWMGAQYVRAFGERHTGAAFVHYMGYGEMTETDPSGAAIGTFSPKDMVAGVGYSYLLSDRWAGGAAFKLLYSSIANYHAAAVAVDLGLNYYDEDEDLSLSTALRNAGAQIKSYDNRTETVPYSFQFGLTKGLEHLPLRFSLTAVDLTRWDKRHYYVPSDKPVSFGRLALNHLVLGAELLPSDVLTLSVGYNFRRGYELKAAGASHWAGVTAGIGLNFSQIKLNLAYAQYHKSTASLMGTVAYTF